MKRRDKDVRPRTKALPSQRRVKVQRCPARAPKGHDFAGSQCGDYAGHDGPHTALVATQFLNTGRKLGEREDKANA